MTSTRWDVRRLARDAVSIGASRRTDIPALFGSWLWRRIEAGWAEYVPAGPPRRLRCSLRPEHVTHFTFWSKWPRPFLRVFDRIRERGYPTLWQVTITGLGGTPVEPHVPEPARVVASVRALAHRIGPAAICWRYDPIFVSTRHDAAFHLETFRRLAGELAGLVDRVVVSFVAPYGRRVLPDLRAYGREHADAVVALPLSEQVDLVGRLATTARAEGIPLAVCCMPALRRTLGLPRAGCNAWSWAVRAWPELRSFGPLRARPCRPDCGCSVEIDIGAYDTCVLGCRYSYGTCREGVARRRLAAHRPDAPGIVATAPHARPARRHTSHDVVVHADSER